MHSTKASGHLLAGRPECRTALVAVELSETSLAGRGKLREAGVRYTFCWIGYPADGARENGVCLVVTDRINILMVDEPHDIGPRILSMRLRLSREAQITIGQLRNAKAVDEDGLPGEILKTGGPILELVLCHLVHFIWEQEIIPQRFKTDVLEIDVPEEQCGFQASCSTVDLVFAVQRIQEKCRERNQPSIFASRCMGAMAWVMPLFVGASVFGCMNSEILSLSRLCFTASERGHMPLILSMISVNSLTPIPSVLAMILVSILFQLHEDVFILIQLTGLAFAVVSATAVCSLLYIRRNNPALNKSRFKVMPTRSS
ncbi:uncharacterized protein DEA37_0000952 [Paragonimus westermani]|uniref:Uncharacterized protein n=1 Tax=Paragonimus westermani TaxID=34504 RepID=A0A5J4NHP7_9TREM|nr:uncharacterized protein DEA37_0000952 [Paragonimus westermani]